jgi:hypothetical protein
MPSAIIDLPLDVLDDEDEVEIYFEIPEALYERLVAPRRPRLATARAVAEVVPLQRRAADPRPTPARPPRWWLPLGLLGFGFVLAWFAFRRR